MGSGIIQRGMAAATLLLSIHLLAATGAACQADIDQPPDPPPPADPLADKIDLLLKDVIAPDGLVYYQLLRKRKGELEAIVADFAPKREHESDDAKLAYLINAYNVFVMHQVLERWPIKKVNKIRGFFDKHKFTLDGKEVTLNYVENKLVRPFGDPRIHAALVCAAVSCPPLRNEAYRALKLDEQLKDNTQRWLADPKKNTAKKKRAYISKIFKWYRKDFDAKPYNDLHGFLTLQRKFCSRRS